MLKDKQQEFFDKFKNLQQEFIYGLRDRQAKLRSHKERLFVTWNNQNLYQFYIDAHNLASSGATFGFNQLSHLAKILEEKSKPFLNSELPSPSLAERQSIENTFFSLEELITRIIEDSEEPYMVIGENLSSIVKEIQQGNLTEHEKHILLVEDDYILAKNIQEQLNTFGYQVSISENIADSEKIIFDINPAALVIDIVLPEGELAGVDLIKEIYNTRKAIVLKDVPIIFISRRTDLDARLAAVKAGGHAYFSKPLDIANLIECLDRLTNRHTEEPYRVLIIDDDKEVAKHYSLILENAGIVASICNTPSNILEIIANIAPDLILMDLNMPFYKGDELVSVIRQIDDYSGIPIIYLSSEKNIEIQIQALLQGGDDFLVKTIRPETLIRMTAYRAKRFRTLRNLMNKDGLTNIYNHRFMKEQIRSEIAKAARDNIPISLAMIDVDFFKKVNDNYGHAVGDQVLKTLARFLIDRVRKTDLVGRYGGEEFLVLFHNTSIENAAKLCEKLRCDFERVQHSHNKDNFYVTFSCGVADYPTFNNHQSLLDAADRALYISKHNGRNQVTIAEFYD